MATSATKGSSESKSLHNFYPTLPSNWWIVWRDVEPVRSALIEVQTKFWVDAVQESLIQNASDSSDSGWPSTWREVAKRICRNVGNLKRWKTGQQTRYAPMDFLALAGSAGLNARDLLPDNITWVARATAMLCKNRIGELESRIFATLCVALPPESKIEISAESIAQIAHLLPDGSGDVQDLMKMAQLAHDGMCVALRSLIVTAQNNEPVGAA